MTALATIAKPVAPLPGVSTCTILTPAFSRYESASRALAEVLRVDECKAIRDKAVAMQEYARQARDTKLIGHATEIRLRAEQRAGELLAEMHKNKGGAEKGVGRRGRNAVATGDRIVPPTLKDIGITKTQSAKWQKLAALTPENFEAKVGKAIQRAEDCTTSSPRYTKSEFTGKDEWFTPGAYIEPARDVLGKIDLDPASCATAQKTVQATRYFTREENGLTRPWHGRVWLNPPFARELIGDFVSKLVVERSAGRVSAAIMLTDNSTDTGWFRMTAKAASAICFTEGRIGFYDADGEISKPTQGQCFFYFGENVQLFTEVFRKIGMVFPGGPAMEAAQ